MKKLADEERGKRSRDRDREKKRRRREGRKTSGLIRSAIEVEGSTLWLLKEISELTGKSQTEIVRGLLLGVKEIPPMRYKIVDGDGVDLDLDLTAEERKILKSRLPDLSMGGAFEHVLMSYLVGVRRAPRPVAPSKPLGPPTRDESIEDAVERLVASEEMESPSEPEKLPDHLWWVRGDLEIHFPFRHHEDAYDKYVARAAIRAAHRKPRARKPLSDEHERMINEIINPYLIQERAIARGQEAEHARILRARYEESGR